MTKPELMTKSNRRALAFLSAWRVRDINPFLLRHKINPLKGQASVLHDAFQFVIDAGAFKPRDMVEHLRNKHPRETDKYIKSFVTDTCDALLEAKVIRKEKSVLCLN